LASTIKSNFEFDIEGFINIADFLVGRLHLLFPKRGRWGGGGQWKIQEERVIKISKSRGGFVIIVIVQSKRCPHPTPPCRK
jgi:hypothetical protein